MRDYLVDVVPVIAKVRRDLTISKALNSNSNPSISELEGLLLSVSNQVNKVMDILSGVPQRKLLLLTIRSYLWLLLKQPI